MWYYLALLIHAILDMQGYDWSVPPTDNCRSEPDSPRSEPRFSLTGIVLLFACVFAVVAVIIIAVTRLP
jgi:hypothetical protein